MNRFANPTRRGLFLAALGLAAALPACPQGSSGGGGASSGRAAVSFCESADPSCVPATDFSIASLLDLYVSVGWMGASAGSHLQTIRFLLPDQNLYQAIETPFEVAQGSGGTALTVQALPVAGSYITQRSLTGIWAVEVWLDGRLKASQAVSLGP